MSKKKEIQEEKLSPKEQELRQLEILANAKLSRVQQELEDTRAEIPEIQVESEAIGVIKKIEYDRRHNEMLKYAVLYRIKKAKSYREGSPDVAMTWDQFCESIGEQSRTVDRALADFGPIFEEFSDNLSDLAGANISKIRYLGRAISDKSAEIEDGSLVVDNVKIALIPENKDEIEALIDNLKETSRQEKAEVVKQAGLEKKRLERDTTAKIEGLTEEKKSLVEENKRLRVFDPKDKDPTWSLEQMEEIKKACITFSLLCRSFVMDDRLKDDRHLQAMVWGVMLEAETELADLNDLWVCNFPFGDQG